MALLKTAVLACVFFALAGLVRSRPSDDYCGICEDHTMCKYKGVDQFNCRYLLVRGVSDRDKEQILLSHNIARNKIALGKERRGLGGQPQPPAANMKKLVWNNELATLAQRWSDQCVPYTSDACRDTKKMAVGQNSYTYFWMEETRNTTTDWEMAVRLGWVDGVEKFDSSLVATDYTRTFDQPHYTQLAWAETETLGCGHVFYRVDTSALWIYDGYVCNYGPAGNVVGQKMYTVGEAATECAPGFKRDAIFEGLCSRRRLTLPVKV